MRVLISGFEPFGGHKLNPTSLLIEELKAGRVQHPDSFVVETVLLPVTFEAAFVRLNSAIEQFNPDVVMCFGQAAGRTEINIENIAKNVINAEIKDNDGVQPVNVRISDSGPDVFPSTLPVQGLEGALQKAQIPVKLSNSAGEYVCNFLFYKLMEANQDTRRLCGFIHIPLLPEQTTDKPSMPLETLKKALSVMLNYIEY